MNERSVVVRLRAEVADYKRRMDEAAGVTRTLTGEIKRAGDMAQTSLGRMVQSATKHRQAWETAGRGLTVFGGATVAALGASAMAAVRWESDWTGVLKTVEGTADELGALEGGLRGLARELPATHSEIAAVAEAAGQLGVRTKDVLSFTRVMIDLGETTNLSADEAATAIAQLMNVMRTAPQDVERLGSALVALGNNGASTERDIILMAQRIAAAGAVVGMTEADVLGLANALASVGIEVEAGGSAVSRIITDIASDVAAGGVSLDKWARVAGVSGAQFAQVWKGDPAEAVTLFIQGLGRMKASGEDVFGVLNDLGQSDVRTSRALLTMATSGDLLADSLDMSAQAWAENTALAEEAGKRYDTTAAKIEIARNNLNDAAISIGESFLPAISSAAEGVSDFAEKIGALPEPLLQVGGGLVGIVGGTALLAGGFLLTVPRVLDMAKSMRQLQKDGSSIPGTMRGIARGAGLAAAAMAGFTVLTAGVEAMGSGMSRTASSVEQTTAALLRMESASDLDELFKGVGSGVDEVESLNGAISRLTSPDLMDRAQDLSGTIRGFFGGGETGADRVRDQFEAIGQSLASLVSSGDAERAGVMFDQISDAWTSQGGSVEELQNLMPAYTDALAEASNQSELAQGSTEGLAESYSTLTGATEYLTEEQVALRAELAEIDASFIDLMGGYDAIIERQKTWAEDTADATESAEDSWTDYYDGFSVGLDQWLAEMQEQVDAQTAWETNMVLLAGRVSQGTLDELARLGPEGAPLVAQLVTASDEQLAELEGVFASRSDGATGAFATAMDTAAPIVAAAAAQLGADAAAEIAAKLAAGTATVTEIMYQYGLEIEGIKPEVQIDTTHARADLESFVRDSQGRKIYVDILGRTTQVVSGPGNYVARAGGGSVFGPGTETSDSIPALLSTNEHVWSAREVRGAGGHAAVASLRAAARSGGLHPVQTMRFADGGSPAWVGQSAAAGVSVEPIDYDRMARATARAVSRVTIGLDGRAVSQSVDEGIGARLR